MNKIPLIENACRELLQYGVRDTRTKCKNLAKRVLLRQNIAPQDPIFWPTGLLAAGLWHCREELAGADGRTDREDGQRGMAAIEASLAAYYDRWRKKGMPLVVLDDLLAGETLLNAYIETEKRLPPKDPGISPSICQEAMEKMAAFGESLPVDDAGSFYYRPAHGDRAVFADGVGLACPFLYGFGAAFGKEAYQELAVRQIVNFLSYGMDGKTGLPYHGYDVTDGCKYGIIGWGRAVGWLLRGMTGCLLSEYGKERLGESCRELTDAVLIWQRQDGYFSWQLQALEGPADTSATAMICAAFKKGLELGVLTGEAYEKALDAGRRAVERSARDGLVYDCSGECEGFSRYPQHYGAYPWALGPALEIL